MSDNDILQEKIKRIEGDVAEIKQDTREINSNISHMRESQGKINTLLEKHDQQIDDNKGSVKTLGRRLWTGLFLITAMSISWIIKDALL